MDQALEKYYEEQFSMFASQGWKDIMEDFTELKKQVQDLSTVVGEQQLFFRQGQLDILNLFLTRKEVTEKAWEELRNE
jgi:hypothetical protein